MKMRKDEIKQQLKQLMVDTWELDISPNDLKDDENNLEKYGINSIDVLELLVIVEEEFGIEIDDNDINSELVESIINMVNYIYEQQ